MMRGAGRGTEPFVIALIAGLGPGRGEFALLRARTAGEDAARSVTMPRTVAGGRPALSGGSRTGHVVSVNACKMLKFSKKAFTCDDPVGIP